MRSRSLVRSSFFLNSFKAFWPTIINLDETDEYFSWVMNPYAYSKSGDPP